MRVLFRWSNRFGKLLSIALVIAVLRKEMNKPADQRTWSGEVAGFVPYEFRIPNLERIKASWWNPDQDRILTPMVWGIGWSINVGRLARMLGKA